MPKTDASDPTKAILGSTGLNNKSLCDYVINVATGCSHGCKFCYVPATPNIRTRGQMLEDVMDVSNPQEQWGEYVAYRDDLPPRLDSKLERKRSWNVTDRGQGVVGMSYSTDCFMDRRAGAISAGVIKVLADHEKYVRVQTRNPVLAANGRPPNTIQVDGEEREYPDEVPLDRDEPGVRDRKNTFHPSDQPFIEAFESAGEYVTIGASINSLDDREVLAIEPNTPPSSRIRGLEKFVQAGINVFVSMSPTYPTMGEDELRDLMGVLSDLDPDVVFHEPINPRGMNFQMTVDAAATAGLDDLSNELDRIRDRDEWTEYSIKHLVWVQQIAEDLDLDVHLWPDKGLLPNVEEETKKWLQAWIDRGSPESFAKRPDPGPMPEIPDQARSML